MSGAPRKISNISSAGANYVSIQINRKTVNCLIDTGAVTSCVDLNLIQKLGPGVHISRTPDHPKLISANNTPMDTLGTVELSVYAQGLTIPCTFTVFRKLSHTCILGLDWLAQNKANIDCGQRLLSLYDGLVVLNLQNSEDRTQLLYIKQTVTVPPNCEAILPVCFKRGHSQPLAVIEAWPPIKNRMIGVAPAIVRPCGENTVCRVINLGVTPRKLRARTPVAQVMRINMLDPFNFKALTGKKDDSKPSVNTITTENIPEHADRLRELQEIGLNFTDTKLSEPDFAKLTQLLYTNKDLFATELSQLPGSTLPGHDIKLTDYTPFRVKQFRQPPHLQEQIRKQCKELLDAKIIEVSNSPWNSPAFLVKKGGGTPDNPQYRFIVDLRMLNKRIAPLFWPLPSVEDAIQQIGQQKANLFSIIDQKSGFFQLGISEGKDYTAFSVGPDHYAFSKLPMGMKNSPFYYMASLTKL